MAGAVGHAAHGDVLARPAEPAGAVALDVGEVDHHVASWIRPATSTCLRPL